MQIQSPAFGIHQWLLANGQELIAEKLPYSSLTNAASAAALPYSLSLLCRVFRLMARISVARVLLLFVASRVFRISSFSLPLLWFPRPGEPCRNPRLNCAGWIARILAAGVWFRPLRHRTQ